MAENLSDSALSALIQTAESATERADWQAAAVAWQKVTQVAPNHPRCFIKAAVALRNLGYFEKSDAVMQSAIAALGPLPEHYVILGDTAMDSARWRLALKHWAQLRAIAPRQAQGYYRAANAHFRLKEPARAEILCANGLIECPTDRRLLLAYAEAAERMGNWTEALARLDYAASIHENDEAIAQRRAKAAANYGNSGGASVSALTVTEQLERAADRLSTGRMSESDIEALLDQLQRSGPKVALQDRIEGYRHAWQTKAPLQRHGGVMRHFDTAQKDPRLASVLAGATNRDRGKAQGDPIRVVFFFPTVTQTDHLTPLYEQMHKDPRFAPIILCSRTRNQVQEDAFGFFSAKYPANEGWQVMDGGQDINQNLSFYELDADLVMFHTPYSLNADRPFYLRADFVARHCRVAHVTYGYPLLTLDARRSHVYAGEHVQNCDLVFAESPVCVAPYAKFLGREKIHVTGYTKVDEFRRHLEQVPFEELAARPGRLDVMWTPHWQVKGDPTGDTETSNFLRYHDVMLRIAARSDILLHVRPHPLLRPRLKALGIMSFAAYDAILEQFRAVGAKVYPAEEGISYVPALMQSAVLVSDFSSLVAEYTITNRPIIFCRTPDVWNNGLWIGTFGKSLIENCCYVVDDAQALETRLEEILTTRRHPNGARMAGFVDGHELFPEGSAVDRICEKVKSVFAAD